MLVRDVRKGQLFSEGNDSSNVWEAIEDGHLDSSRDDKYWTVMARNMQSDIIIPFTVDKDYPQYLKLTPWIRSKPQMSIKWLDTNECIR